MKVEVTVVFAFDNVPDELDLDEDVLTVEGVSKAMLMLNGKIAPGAAYIAHETDDVTPESEFVI